MTPAARRAAVSTAAIAYGFVATVTVALVQRPTLEPPLAALAVVAAGMLLAALAATVGPTVRWAASAAAAERPVRATDASLLVVGFAGGAAALLIAALLAGAPVALVVPLAAAGVVVVLIGALVAPAGPSRSAGVASLAREPADPEAWRRLRLGRRAAGMTALLASVAVQVVLFVGDGRRTSTGSAIAAAWSMAAVCCAAAGAMAGTWAVLASRAHRAAGRDAWQRRRVRASVLGSGSGGGGGRAVQRLEDLDAARAFVAEVQPSLEAQRSFWTFVMAGAALLLLGGALKSPAELPDRVWVAIEATVLLLFRIQTEVWLHRAREHMRTSAGVPSAAPSAAEPS